MGYSAEEVRFAVEEPPVDEEHSVGEVLAADGVRFVVSVHSAVGERFSDEVLPVVSEPSWSAGESLRALLLRFVLGWPISLRCCALYWQLLQS